MTSSNDNDQGPAFEASSVRTPRTPLISRKIWILGTAKGRVQAAVDALESAGHQVRAAESGAELAPVLREFRPDLIIIDMQEQADRGRHVAIQLRADRATRQLPIILVGARGIPLKQGDKVITGPTRRYALPLDAPSVLNAIVAEL
jgi:CheY-like chemotaxis protein